MRPGNFLNCVDTPKERFNALRRHDNLPFTVDDQGGKWQEFSLDDAFSLRVMLDLMGGDGIAQNEADQLKGLPPAYAAKVVENCLFDCDVHPLDMPADADLWFAVVIFEDVNTDGTALRFSRWFAGPMSEFPAWVSAEAASWANRVPVRTCLVNAARAAQFVRKRAAELKLPEANEVFGGR